MDQDRIEKGMLVTQEGMILNKINIQTILQLLVEKGIVTREEVVAKREYIGNQPRYNRMLENNNILQQANQENIKFSETFQKILNKTATDEERNYVSNKFKDYVVSNKDIIKKELGED